MNKFARKNVYLWRNRNKCLFFWRISFNNFLSSVQILIKSNKVFFFFSMWNIHPLFNIHFHFLLKNISKLCTEHCCWGRPGRGKHIFLSKNRLQDENFFSSFDPSQFFLIIFNKILSRFRLRFSLPRYRNEIVIFWENKQHLRYYHLIFWPGEKSGGNIECWIKIE